MKLRYALSATALLAPFGCASLLGVDAYSDSTEELCQLLEQCYQVKDCRGRLGPRLDAASADERKSWLSAVTDQACLEQCSAARRCLNIAPVCAPQDAPCQTSQECCGFLGGVRACGPNGACCLSKGAACASPNECCDGDCRNGHCGGTQCFEPGEACLNPFDCCTSICEGGVCSEGVCIELGGVCQKSEDCCEGKCLDGRCGYEQCRTANEACASTGECCAGLECFDIPASPGKKLCQAEKPCAPLAFPCEATADCCVVGDKPLVCDPAQKLCGEACLSKGAVCLGDGQCCGKKCEGGVCGCSTDACTQAADCCAGQCIGGKCVADCGTASCHDECVPGGPLSPSCPVAIAPKIDPKCIQKVCDKDGYCCCKDWDLTCVQLALTECGKAACQ